MRETTNEAIERLKDKGVIQRRCKEMKGSNKGKYTGGGEHDWYGYIDDADFARTKCEHCEIELEKSYGG